MSESMNVLVAVLLVGLWTVIGLAEELPAEPEAKSKEEIQVMDLVILSTNWVMVGTNAMTVVGATNLMATRQDSLDIIAVHGSPTGEGSVEKNSAVMQKIVNVGVPLVIVEENGEFAWREQSGGDGVRSVKVGTDQFAALQQLWKRRKAIPGEAREPALQATVSWDETTESYELSRVELGIVGRSVWLVHEQRETDEDRGTIGIQIKKQW
jgi:hypothetical protein